MKTYRFPTTLNADVIQVRIAKVAAEKGVQVTTAGSTGTAHGHGFVAEYEIGDGVIVLRVTQKPFLVPWFAVDAGVAELYKHMQAS